MSVQLAVIQTNPLQKCRRCGTCCEYICIPHSPRQLRERFEQDRAYSHEEGTSERAIRVIQPMLEGRCRGKLVYEDGSVERYVYGPCANLSYEEVDGQLLAKCMLHGKPEKPYMCSEYPFYGGAHYPFDEPNPGYIQGCGYNLDPFAGWSVSRYQDNLWPLNEDEL